MVVIHRVWNLTSNLEKDGQPPWLAWHLLGIFLVTQVMKQSKLQSVSESLHCSDMSRWQPEQRDPEKRIVHKHEIQSSSLELKKI